VINRRIRYDSFCASAWHAPSSRHLRALLSVCAGCSFGGLGWCSCRVCVCFGVGGVVLCRRVCVCDLLIFLRICLFRVLAPLCTDRYSRIRYDTFWLYLDAEVLVLPPPILSSELCSCWLPIFVDIQLNMRTCFFRVLVPGSVDPALLLVG